MRSKQLFMAIGNIDDRFISEDGEDISIIKDKVTNTVRFSPRLRITIPVAACLCIIALGAYALLRPSLSDVPGKPVLQWSAQFSAEDYFKYNDVASDGMSSAGSLADYALPYSKTRSFSDNRENYEIEGVIPRIPEHPLFNCSVNYNDDGSIYSVVFSWHIRSLTVRDSYSDLSITAGYQEVEKITDCIFIALDDNGNIIEPAVTVTERDGVKIVAEGNENTGKTLTFQNGSGWYQVEGSWNNSYALMVTLLDWFWEHPIDFGRFPIEAGDNFTSTTLSEMPNAFSGYIPNFAAYGFLEEWDNLSLKNGTPYAFEGQFIAHVPEELIPESRYYSEVEGWTVIHWCVLTNPEYYLYEISLGDLNELTEQVVYNQFDSSRNQSSIAFTWDGLFIQVYSNTAEELWTILEVLIGTKG